MPTTFSFTSLGTTTFRLYYVSSLYHLSQHMLLLDWSNFFETETETETEEVSVLCSGRTCDLTLHLARNMSAR